MTIWIAILLGLVQGLCEFLPVSSSGHLVLLQRIFGVSEGALFFDSMLHIGTLAAVLSVYRKSVWQMITHPFQKKVGLLLAATAVTTLLALAFGDTLGELYGGAYLGFGFLFTSLLLTLGDQLGNGKKSVARLSYPGAAGIGLIQGIAILPGVSRSGSTITAGRFFGLTKEEAAEFSFLLSIPAILGSLVLQLPSVMESGLSGITWPTIAVGTITAAISGYFAIRFVLRLINRKSLRGFAVYTAALGALVLLDQFVLKLFF